MKLIVLLICISSSLNVFAEYRVYQYIVKNKVPIVDSPKSHLVTSTLDPVSYLSYHGGSTLLTVDLLRTWMCPGHTAKKDVCDGPYKKLALGTNI